MKFIVFTLIQFACYCLFSQSQITILESDNQRIVDYTPLKTCLFSIKDGKKNVLNGHYKDGQKVGIWNYYDNNGKLILKRNYFNNISYEPVFPKLPKAHSKLGIGTIKQKERDSLGILPYHFVQGKDIALSVRYLQLHWFKDQKELVSEELLQSAFSQLLIDENITKFQSMELKDVISFSQNELDNLTLIGFMSKIDAFFDGNRQLSDARVIAVQPLALNEKGDTLLMPVMYYPETRQNLSAFKINSYDYIQQLDDLFHYSLFTGPIYRTYFINSKVNTNYLTKFPNDLIFLNKEVQEIKVLMEHQIRYFNGVEEKELKNEVRTSTVK